MKVKRKSFLRFLFSFWFSTPLSLVLIANAAIWGFMPLFAAWLSQYTVDAATAGTGTDIIWRILAFTVVYVLLEFVSRILNSSVERVAAERINLKLTETMVTHARNIPFEEFEHEETNSDYMFASANAGNVWSLFESVMSGVMFIARVSSFIIFYMSVSYVLCLIFIPLLIAFTIQLNRQAGREYSLNLSQVESVKKTNYLSSILTDKQYAKERKLFRYGNEVIRRWKLSYAKVADEAFRLFRRNKAHEMASLGAGQIFIASFVAVTAVGVLAGTATLGGFTGSFAFVNTLGGSLSDLSGIVKDLKKQYLNSKFVFAFLTRFANSPEILQATTSHDAVHAGDIVLEHASFAYPSAVNRMAVNDVSLTIRAGETVAIVGKNGAGKSTLAYLIAGIYSPSCGNVLINGKTPNIRAGKSDVRMIFQEPIRYDFSFYDNLTLGTSENSTYGEMVELLKLDKVLARFPDGKDEILGKTFGNTDLSGGEWQRVALARCFIQDADVYILDEPTSSMDAKIEYTVFSTFTRLAAQKTKILISHRLGSMKLVDRIFVMDEGRLVACGSHKALMKESEYYRQLYDTQAHLYTSGESERMEQS